MPKIIYEYLNEDGDIIHIQGEALKPQRVTRGNTEDSEGVVVKRVKRTFEATLCTVKAAANGLKNVIDEVNPDEAAVEFTITSEGEAGLFSICRTAAGAEFKVTLTWKKSTAPTV